MIHIAESYTSEYSNNILTVCKGNLIKGTIKISMASGATFNTTTNIAADLKEKGGDENPLQIVGTAGNDEISNTLDGATIQALAGNDTIISTADNVSIDGGKGDDSISNSGANVLFKYAPGDGNDLISGFNETSKLSIGSGTDSYSTLKSGDNLIINVGTSKITLAGAASLKTVGIAGTLSAFEIEGLSFNAEGGYYEIGDAQALRALASFVTGGFDCEGMTFKVTDDITVENFTAINNFAGTFEGNGHLITSSKSIFGAVSGSVSGHIYGAGDGKLTQVYKVTPPAHFRIGAARSAGAITFGGEQYFTDGAAVKVTLETQDNLHYADKNYNITINGTDAALTATNIYIQLDAAHIRPTPTRKATSAFTVRQARIQSSTRRQM